MRQAIALRPDYAQAYFMLGTVLKQKGELAAAITALREAIRLNTADPGPFNTLGQILKQKGDLEGSKQAFADGAKAKAKIEERQADLLRNGMAVGRKP
jgi:cytochrome c-type biogenesis protein CcmH/NrfG